MPQRFAAYWTRSAPILVTLAAAAIGGAVFVLLGLPAPWLSGAILLVGAFAVAGVPVRVPDRLLQVAFVALGIQMGTGVTPQTLSLLPTWPVTMIGLVLSIPAITIATGAYLTRVANVDRLTAFFASVPGALTYVMASALTTTADIPKIAFVQTTRLFLLAVGLPAGLAIAGELGTLADLPSQGSAIEIALMLAASAVCGFLFDYWAIPGGIVVGAMFASAILHGTGLVTAAVPDWLLLPCYGLLGAMIGARFHGTTWAMMRQSGLAATVAFAVSGLVAALFGALAAMLVDIPIGQIVIAFAPGGFEAMVVLGFALGFDPAFIAAHHLVRFVGIALALPVVVALLNRAPPNVR